MARHIPTLRPSPGLPGLPALHGGSSVRRGPGTGWFGGTLLVLAVILATLVAVWWLRRDEAVTAGGVRGAGSQAAAVVVEGAARPELLSEKGMVIGGLPRAKRAGVSFTVLRNTAYVVGYSEERRDPLWAAYHVGRVEGAVKEQRPRGAFLTDERTAARVKHQDFTGSGYDRGHMAPNFAIATRYGAAAQLETFLLSNICPQAPALNEKVWEKLEMSEIEYANRDGEVWVMDGPVFEDLSGGAVRKLRTGVSVPGSFYKIVVENSGGRVRLFSVMMPQTVKGTELPGQYLTSVGAIEERTGLEFLWALDAGEQRELKGKVWPMW